MNTQEKLQNIEMKIDRLMKEMKSEPNIKQRDNQFTLLMVYMDRKEQLKNQLKNEGLM